MSTLVFFGNSCLQNKVFTANYDGSRAATGQDVQTLDIAREPGVAVINTKYEPKVITLEGQISIDSGVSSLIDNLQESIELFDNALNKIDERFLRFVPEYVEHTGTSVTTGWAASDDAANLAVTSTRIQTSTNALEFDIDVSASANDYATLTYTGAVALDLSDYSGTGNLEFSLYIPDIFYVTSIDFRFGNDSSNYYSQSFSTNYEGRALENGWNLFSADWASMTETGTVDDNTLDYIYIRINYDSAAIDIDNCVLDGVMWVNEDRLRNHPAHRLGEIKRNGDHYANNLVDYTAEFLNSKGWAESTHSYDLWSQAGITVSSNTQAFDIDGSLAARPVISMVVGTATNVNTITITNENDDGAVVIDPTSVANGDTITFDRYSSSVTQNGSNVKVDGVLPVYYPGKNRTTLSVQQSGSVTVTQPTTTGYITASAVLPIVWAAQRIQAPFNGSLNLVQLYGYSQELRANYRFRVLADSPGAPSTSLQLTTADLNTTLAYQPVTLNYAVTSASFVWIAMPLRSIDASSKFNWAYHTTSGYSGGYRAYGTSSSINTLPAAWTTFSSTGSDMTFRAVFEPTPTYVIDWSAEYKKLYSA